MNKDEKEDLIKALEYGLHKCIDVNGDAETHYNTFANAIEIATTNIEDSESFAIGKEVEITDCLHGHEFNNGEKVKVIGFENTMWNVENKKGVNWWINENEAKVINKTRNETKEKTNKGSISMDN